MSFSYYGVVANFVIRVILAIMVLSCISFLAIILFFICSFGHVSLLLFALAQHLCYVWGVSALMVLPMFLAKKISLEVFVTLLSHQEKADVFLSFSRIYH